MLPVFNKQNIVAQYTETHGGTAYVVETQGHILIYFEYYIEGLTDDGWRFEKGAESTNTLDVLNGASIAISTELMHKPIFRDPASLFHRLLVGLYNEINEKIQLEYKQLKNIKTMKVIARNEKNFIFDDGSKLAMKGSAKKYHHIYTSTSYEYIVELTNGVMWLLQKNWVEGLYFYCQTYIGVDKNGVYYSKVYKYKKTPEEIKKILNEYESASRLKA